MEIRQLITFQKVADLGNFSKAAETLGYSQSAVTVQIAQLEKEFNVRLFDRFGKKVAITPAGKQLLKRADNILNQIENLRSDLGGESSHEHYLHIGALNSLCSFPVSHVMEAFLKKHPDYHVKITRDSPSNLITMMEKNEVDIIYILDALRADVHWKRVLEKKEPIVFVCNVDSPLCKKENLALEEIIHEPFYLTEKEDNYRHALDQYLAMEGFSINPLMEVGDTEVIVHMIQANQGVSFLPYFAVQKHIKEGKLALLPISNFSLNMHHQIFYYKDKWVTDEMLEFIRTIEAELL
jgi:DNA-binding transcriptional LysR family regulator